MARYKLTLEDAFEEDFSLIAIHCSEEDYKIAYLLNSFGKLHLKREMEDVFYDTTKVKASFPLFFFEDTFQQIKYYLVANKCKTQTQKITTSESLFGNTLQNETIITHLISEYKKADYFLKVENDSKTASVKKLITAINNIKQVISAYKVDTSSLKSINNLIFD